MKIGYLAKKANVNIQTIRYYERIGILKPELRRESGYRVFNEDSIRRLLFIKRAQNLGFSLNDIKELLNLSASSSAGRRAAREKSIEKIAMIQEKITDLKELEKTLKKLVANCARRELTSPCPILEGMEIGISS